MVQEYHRRFHFSRETFAIAKRLCHATKFRRAGKKRLSNPQVDFLKSPPGFQHFHKAASFVGHFRGSCPILGQLPGLCLYRFREKPPILNLQSRQNVCSPHITSSSFLFLTGNRAAEPFLDCAVFYPYSRILHRGGVRTGFLKFSERCVGGDAHIDPAGRTDFTEISGEFERALGAMWASPPTQNLKIMRNLMIIRNRKIPRRPRAFRGGSGRRPGRRACRLAF